MTYHPWLTSSLTPRDIRFFPKWVRLVMNGKKSGFFSDHTSLHFGSKLSEKKYDLKNSGFLSPVWPRWRQNLTSSNTNKSRIPKHRIVYWWRERGHRRDNNYAVRLNDSQPSYHLIPTIYKHIPVKTPPLTRNNTELEIKRAIKGGSVVVNYPVTFQFDMEFCKCRIGLGSGRGETGSRQSRQMAL